MISWMRLKVINRTSLFINHSSAIRSVDHISLPPQLDLGSQALLTTVYNRLYTIRLYRVYYRGVRVSSIRHEVKKSESHWLVIKFHEYIHDKTFKMALNLKMKIWIWIKSIEKIFRCPKSLFQPRSRERIFP